MAKRYDTLIRLLLVGDTGVGKTCLICQYACNEFHESHVTTVGVDFKMKTINLDGKNLRLQIWDTAGQERFESITKQFYTRAQGCILVFDICSRSSFESLAKWLLYIKQYAKEETEIILVGNKSDLTSKRQVPTHVAEKFATDNNIPFYEVSAKDFWSLKQPFEDICRDVLAAESLRSQETESIEKIDLASSKKPRLRSDSSQDASNKKCC